MMCLSCAYPGNTVDNSEICLKVKQITAKSVLLTYEFGYMKGVEYDIWILVLLQKVGGHLAGNVEELRTLDVGQSIYMVALSPCRLLMMASAASAR